MVARWRITQATVVQLTGRRAARRDSPGAGRRVPGALSQRPLPGQSLLQVEPLPGAPDTYTVPFGGAGFLVYAVDHDRQTVELVGMIWLGF
jgi:hypothetical protein